MLEEQQRASAVDQPAQVGVHAQRLVAHQPMPVFHVASQRCQQGLGLDDQQRGDQRHIGPPENGDQLARPAVPDHQGDGRQHQQQHGAVHRGQVVAHGPGHQHGEQEGAGEHPFDEAGPHAQRVARQHGEETRQQQQADGAHLRHL